MICPYQLRFLFHHIPLKSTQSPNLHCFQSTSSYLFPTFIPPMHSPQRVNLSKYKLDCFSFLLETLIHWLQIHGYQVLKWSAWLWVTSAAYLSDSASFHCPLLTLTFYTSARLALVVLLKTTVLHLPTRFWYKLFPFFGRLIPLPRTWSSQYLTHLLFICSSIISSVLITFFQSFYISL